MAGQAEEITLLKAQVAEMSAVLAKPQVKDFLKTFAKGKEKGQVQRKEHDVNAHAVTAEGKPSKKPWEEDIPELSSPSYSPPTTFSYSSNSSSSSNPRRRNMLALQRLLPNHEKALSWLPGSSGVELVRWINVGLEKAWPFFKEACLLIIALSSLDASSGLIKVKLETVFNKYRAGDIEVFSLGKLNLGNSCPFVQGIKVVPSKKDNQCCLEIQLDWRQNEDQEMLLHVSTMGPEFVVQVKNFVVYCVMRLTFAPLAHQLPCFGAVVFSIIEPPLVDFQTKFISGDVKKMPGLEKAVDNVLLSALMDLLVWPGRVVVPVLQGDYSDLEASCAGYLHVHLLEGRDVANKDVTGRSDPYVVLFVRRRADLIQQSTKMRDTANPVWNEQFMFSIEDLEMQRLTIKLMNFDEVNLSVFVGTAELAIHQLKASMVEDLWIDLVGNPAKLHGRSAGKIHLLVEFKPENHTADKKDTGNLAFGMDTSSAVMSIQPDGTLSSSVMDHASGNGALSCGLGVILAGNSSAHEDKDLRVVTRNDVINSMTDSSNIEVQGSPISNAHIKAQPQEELAGNSENSTCLDETAPFVKEGYLLNATVDGVVVGELLEFADYERQPCPLVAEERGSHKVISQKLEESYSAVSGGSRSSEKGYEACIAENYMHDNVNMDKDTADQPIVSMGKDISNQHNARMVQDPVNQPNLLVVGDPAWGLNGLSLEHCNTSAIREDMFSSEIFEVD
ncbi:hypothetical protein L7F22_028249 [Adiantum nelumboides]|nr:hypothetical protein [Adiantum nelumboides]